MTACTIFFQNDVPFSIKNQYLRIMKMNIEWKRIILFIIISLGLILITKSLSMTAGILILLFVLDRILAKWEKKHLQQ